nr:hypothetical protein [Streptomyces spinosus]
MIPAAQTPLPHLAGDPDRRWAEAEYGGHFPSEARTYTSWQSGGVR